MGSSGTARTVGRAGKTNPVALAIPCHQVIAADDSPGGYRRKLGRQLNLLATERQLGAGAQSEASGFQSARTGPTGP